MGAVYCSDGIENNWYSDELTTTLIAYRIIKNDSALQHFKEPIQLYVLGTKQKYHGWNTYRAANIISTILPDLLNESNNKKVTATVSLSGRENKTLTEFPYKTVLSAGERLQIEKKDGIPLIYSAYSIKRVTEENPGDAFEISTEINGGNPYFTAGKTVKITAKVVVKQKNAEHLMIEIPIPAGCSYASKPSYYWQNNEVYREYYKEKTVIFCERLPEGEYQFGIELLPRYSGTYTVNPAKIEMMYFPVINANNAIEKVWIGDENKLNH